MKKIINRWQYWDDRDVKLYDKNLKQPSEKCFNEQLQTWLKQMKKVESFSKERENIKKNQMKIVELKIQ